MTRHTSRLIDSLKKSASYREADGEQVGGSCRGGYGKQVSGCREADGQQVGGSCKEVLGNTGEVAAADVMGSR